MRALLASSWLLLAIACRREPAAAVDELAPRSLERAEGERYWTKDESWVELVPSIAVPSNAAEGEQVAVFLRLADGAQIVEQDGELRFPPGTEIDRLEWLRRGPERSLADVRGTRIDAQGVAWDHTLRRTRLAPDTALTGFEWRADSVEAHARATRALIERATELPPARGLEGEKREAYLAGIERKNECRRCHQPAIDDATQPQKGRVVRRGTDASGFFTPRDVLSTQRVLEGYGRFDPNRTREAVTVLCADAPTRYAHAASSRIKCDRGQLPVAQYDPVQARKTEAERHKRWCRSQRYLLAHMSSELAKRYAANTSSCD